MDMWVVVDPNVRGFPLLILISNLVEILQHTATHCNTQKHTETHEKYSRRLLWVSFAHSQLKLSSNSPPPPPLLVMERRGAGVEYHFQEFNEPYAPS